MSSIVALMPVGDLLRVVRVDGGAPPTGDGPVEHGDDLYLTEKQARVVVDMLSRALERALERGNDG